MYMFQCLSLINITTKQNRNTCINPRTTSTLFNYSFGRMHSFCRKNCRCGVKQYSNNISCEKQCKMQYNGVLHIILFASKVIRRIKAQTFFVLTSGHWVTRLHLYHKDILYLFCQVWFDETLVTFTLILTILHF